MLPAHPPFPTAWSLPFHPDAGIQTSILMSESIDGAIVAATRQNAGTAGTDGGASARPLEASSFARSPGAADVIVVCASPRALSPSHEAGVCGCAASAAANDVAANATIMRFIACSI